MIPLWFQVRWLPPKKNEGRNPISHIFHLWGGWDYTCQPWKLLVISNGRSFMQHEMLEDQVLSLISSILALHVASPWSQQPCTWKMDDWNTIFSVFGMGLIFQVRRTVSESGIRDCIISRWWFQQFFIFTTTWGRLPFWRSYFSNGLVQKPTRYFFPIFVDELRWPFESCWDFHSWGCLRFQSVAAVAVVSDLGRWQDDDSQECLGCTVFP